MDALIKFQQRSFSGGMNQQVDPTRIGQNEYPLLINGRTRADTIKPIYLPELLNIGVTGTFQGHYAAGSYHVIFVSGLAYYKDFNYPNSSWTNIVGFMMSTTAETFWAELVPASTMNFARVPTASGASSAVSLTSTISGTPQCMVVQDGINQPWVIFPDGTCRVANGYNDWTTSDREYVPIGKMMLYHNAILYVVSPDCTQIYRSVSGRPLDFMVNVDTLGGKPAPLETDGGAQTVSHRVSYDAITCMAALNSPDGGFYVSTAKASFRVVPDYDNTIFGEPQFDNISLFPTGSFNQFSFADILGDSVFVDTIGIRSFNAVSQVQYEGRNAPFSAKVDNLFLDVVQTLPCVAKFDNYAMFSVQTVYGAGILVYDELTKTHVSLDIFSGIASVRQFCVVRTATSRRLLFITSDNQLYEYYASDDVAPMQVYLGEYCTQDPEVNQHPMKVRIVLLDAISSGEVTVTPYVDRKVMTDQSVSEPITATATAQTVPVTVPFGPSTADTVRNVVVDIGRVRQGWKVGILLSFDCDATVSHVTVESEPETQTVGHEQEADDFARFSA